MLNIQINRKYSHIWSSSVICYNSRNNLYFKFVFVEWSIYIALNKINITFCRCPMKEAHLPGVSVALYMFIATLTSFKLEHNCLETKNFRSWKTNSIGFISGELAGALILKY